EIIKNQYEETRKKAENVIESQGEEGLRIIKKMTDETKEAAALVGDQVDNTIEVSIKERIALLKERIDRKQAEYDQLLSEANQLQSTLPPPDSICELYIECSICAANPECGWCADQNVCMSGDQYGATQDICKVWDYRICRGECAGNTDCQVAPFYF